MWAAEIEKRMDILTGLRTEDSFREKLSGSAALCLIELKEPVSEKVVGDFAFFLQQSLGQADLEARIGDRYFLIFLPGCRTKADVRERFSLLEQEAHMAGTLCAEICVGAILCREAGQDYDGQLRCAKAALYTAKNENKKLCVLSEEDVMADGAPNGVLGAEACSWEIEKIPEYSWSRETADMEFVGRLIDLLLFPKEFPAKPEAGLEMLCGYFGADAAYIVERLAGETSYRIFYQWSREQSRVKNYNLERIPGVIGDRYGKIFENRSLLVCNTLDVLEDIDPVMAQRQKLRGTRSMMQAGMTEYGSYIGYICLADTKRERRWTKEEAATFDMAAAVVAACVQQIRSKERIAALQENDPLTEAWNYGRFLISGAQRLHLPKAMQAVVTLDIKNFKIINAEYGFDAGNGILKEAGVLFRNFMRGMECYARIEADEFVLLLEHSTLDELQQRLRQILRRLEQIPERKLGIVPVCMAGVCIVEPEDQDMALLVDHANMARKALKDYHKSAFSFYNKEAELKLLKEQRYTSLMRRAAANEEFVVYYQPRISLKDKQIVGMEALVRWRTAEGTLIPPDEFIPLFEKNGFITELDLYVFERVCRLMRKWMDQGRKVVPIGVNISRVHIKEPDCLERLTDLCGRYEIAPENLELEITESAFLGDQNLLMQVAEKIKQSGFVLVMDDFGTGYSSLSLLKDLPVDIMKLDREFFQKDLNRRERIVIANLISMAKQLGIQVVSEGIENQESEEFLREVGCEFAQGYLYGRPEPEAVAEALLFGGK